MGSASLGGTEPPLLLILRQGAELLQAKLRFPDSCIQVQVLYLQYWLLQYGLCALRACSAFGGLGVKLAQLPGL